MAGAIQPVIQPTPVDRKFLMLDSYARVIAAFVRAVLEATSGLVDSGVATAGFVRPEIKSVFHFHSSGAVIDYLVPQDCYFIGCCGYAGELIVTNNGDSSSAVESGSNGVRFQVLGYWNTTGNSLGQRTKVSAGQHLALNVNSGPRMSLMLFESA